MLIAHVLGKDANPVFDKASMTRFERLCSSKADQEAVAAGCDEMMRTWEKSIQAKGQTLDGYKAVVGASTMAGGQDVEKLGQAVSAMFKLGDEIRRLTPEQFAQIKPALPKMLNGLAESCSPNPFGFAIKDLDPYDSLKPNIAADCKPGSTDCGPLAITELLYRSPHAREFGEQQPLFERIRSTANTGPWGTTPGNMTDTLTQFAKGQGLETKHQQFTTADDAISHAAKNVPCIIKLGTNLTYQHYAVITDVRQFGQERVFFTADKMAIPESSLKKTIGTAPAGNSVWTVHERFADLKVPDRQKTGV